MSAVTVAGRVRRTPHPAACNGTPGRPNIAAMENAMLTPDLAARFMRVALGHVTREFPNKLDHVLHGPQDLATPRCNAC